MNSLFVHLEIIRQPQKRGFLLDIHYSAEKQCYILQHTALGTVMYHPESGKLHFQEWSTHFYWEKRVLTIALRCLHKNVFSIQSKPGKKLVMYV